MKILRDDGIYRHLVFQQPVNSLASPFRGRDMAGALCIRGDVKHLRVLALADMFEFFRSPMTQR